MNCLCEQIKCIHCKTSEINKQIHFCDKLFAKVIENKEAGCIETHYYNIHAPPNTHGLGDYIKMVLEDHPDLILAEDFANKFNKFCKNKTKLRVYNELNNL